MSIFGAAQDNKQGCLCAVQQLKGKTHCLCNVQDTHVLPALRLCKGCRLSLIAEEVVYVWHGIRKGLLEGRHLHTVMYSSPWFCKQSRGNIAGIQRDQCFLVAVCRHKAARSASRLMDLRGVCMACVSHQGKVCLEASEVSNTAHQIWREPDAVCEPDTASGRASASPPV